MRGGGWAGQGYRPGTNKEDFDAEVSAIYIALDILDQRQESCHRYTLSALLQL